MPLDLWVAKSSSFLDLVTGETRSAPSPGPVGWDPFYTFDLTSPQPVSQSSGNRALDSSVNRAAQTTWGPGGVTITAERDTVGGTIWSSDVLFQYKGLPNYFAAEADISFGGYFGIGCFPAWWVRPLNGGQGELDIFEVMSNQPSGNSRYKSTVILTSGSPYNVGSKAVQLDSGAQSPGKVGAPYPPTGVTTYRIEKIPNKITYFVNGVNMGTITQAQVDAQATTTSKWANQFENAAQQWYLRLTYQFGPPTDGRSFNAGGTPTSAFVNPNAATMTVSRMQVWQYAP